MSNATDSSRVSPLPVPPKSAKSECVKVVVRCRPMTEKEIANGNVRVVDIFPDIGVVELKDPKNGTEPKKRFTFDAAYDWNSRQADVYDETVHPLRGVIPNSFDQIFNHIARSQNQQYLVRSSYLEIYQEEIRDLLNKDQTKRLELKERADVGVYVKDLSSFVCKSIREIEHVMTIGNQNRAVGATNMNEHSSRSHAIFIITIEHSQL
ncbi:kinesin-like protein, partial [Dinothrombium tinctorium]